MGTYTNTVRYANENIIHPFKISKYLKIDNALTDPRPVTNVRVSNVNQFPYKINDRMCSKL